MRALRGVTIAFVCMNLPYTMTAQQAASGVLAFLPRTGWDRGSAPRTPR